MPQGSFVSELMQATTYRSTLAHIHEYATTQSGRIRQQERSSHVAQTQRVLTLTTALSPRTPSEQLAKLEWSRSVPNTATSPRVARSAVRGAERDAWNDMRVVVANARFASSVSAPPKALRTLHVALCPGCRRRISHSNSASDTEAKKTHAPRRPRCSRSGCWC